VIKTTTVNNMASRFSDSDISDHEDDDSDGVRDDSGSDCD